MVLGRDTESELTDEGEADEDEDDDDDRLSESEDDAISDREDWRS